MEVTVVVGEGDTPTTLVLRGELDLATVTELDRQVDRQLAAGRTRLAVDLAEVTFCDSTGLNGLVRAKNRCRHQGGSLSVTNVRGEVARVIEVSGLLGSLTPEP